MRSPIRRAYQAFVCAMRMRFGVVALSERSHASSVLYCCLPIKARPTRALRFRFLGTFILQFLVLCSRSPISLAAEFSSHEFAFSSTNMMPRSMSLALVLVTAAVLLQLSATAPSKPTHLYDIFYFVTSIQNFCIISNFKISTIQIIKLKCVIF